MPQLIAQGPQPQFRWRRRLEPDVQVVLGRADSDWSVPWDEHISRQHVSLVWRGGVLHVERLPEARNPVFYRGQAGDCFVVASGDHFVIGSTTFTLSEEHLGITVDAPRPRTEHVFPPALLQTIPFRDASQLIDVLSQLPDVIAGATTDEELFVQLVNLLFRGVASATFAAVVAERHDVDTARTLEVLHWDRRNDSLTEPSEHLIRAALARRETVVHLWSADPDQGEDFTQSGETAWAFCTPVEGSACRGWALYLAGESLIAHPSQIEDDVKFAEVVARTVGHLSDLRQLERHRSALGQFISPVVLNALGRRDPEEVLAPQEADVSVLFCDLRGFARQSEQSGDDLMGLLQRVSLALGVMTHHILANDGVVGDFHGDSAMGFWGWPLAQPDAAFKACRAALAIRSAFSATQQAGHPLADFRVGIGIGTGRAVAGKIGTVDQVKVTVFGPVVNLASRLEEMTKALRAPVLIDEETAMQLRTAPGDEFRLRRVARVRPYGLDAPLEVTELLPPAAGAPTLSNQDIAYYEQALDALLAGDWERAFERLHHVPAHDRVKDFLTVFIAQHHRTPPNPWDGVIPLRAKSASL